MVEVNTAILIDVDQGAGLVECGVGERNAVLDRGQCQASNHHRVSRIVGCNGLTSCPVVAAGF